MELHVFKLAYFHTQRSQRDSASYRKQSNISTFISIIKRGYLSIINALQAKNKVSLIYESESSFRLTQHREITKLLLSKARLLKIFVPRYFA